MRSWLEKTLVIARYGWAIPNTLIGLALGILLGGRFQTVAGVIEIHGPWIAKALSRMPVPAQAMTMGHVVFGRDSLALDLTRTHERVHVRQYERWGPFFLPAYLGVSACLYLIGRDGYRENPFEIEAYAVDDPTNLTAMSATDRQARREERRQKREAKRQDSQRGER